MNVVKLADRLRTRRILLVTYFAAYDSSDSTPRILELYQQIRKMHPSIYLSIIVIMDKANFNQLDILKAIFNDIFVISEAAFKKPSLSFMPLIDNNFDLIDLHSHKAGSFINLMKKYHPKAKIIFNLMESKVQNSIMLAIQALYYCLRADKVLTSSKQDQKKLSKFIKKSKLHCIPNSSWNSVKKAIIQTYS
jgi:hypothetical protein